MRISDWSSDVCSSDLSQAASSAARPDAAETALSIFEACERRGSVDRQDAFEMRGLLLAGRRFEQARRFTASHPAARLRRTAPHEDQRRLQTLLRSNRVGRGYAPDAAHPPRTASHPTGTRIRATNASP